MNKKDSKYSLENIKERRWVNAYYMNYPLISGLSGSLPEIKHTKLSGIVKMKSTINQDGNIIIGLMKKEKRG